MITNQLAECYFLDVGQGSSQVVLLPPGMGSFVIDGGDSAAGAIALDVLRGNVSDKSRIRALVISHSHEDHMGGALRILEEYAELIDVVVFPDDRPSRKSTVYQRIQELRELGRFPKKGSTTRAEGITRIFPREDPDATASSEGPIRLLVLAPTFERDLESDEKPAQEDPNTLSAVIALCCSDRSNKTMTRIVFAGDAPRLSWEDFIGEYGRPYSCDVATMPHHGGRISLGSGFGREDFQWLFARALIPDHVIVSVGTSNRHGHPVEHAISAAMRSGAVVLCTQATSKCCPDLEQLRREALVKLQRPCRSTDLPDATPSGASQNVACASTVIVDISSSEVLVRRADEHQDEIDRRLHEGWWSKIPPCRNATLATCK